MNNISLFQPTLNEVFCLAPSSICGSEPVADMYKSFHRGELVALKVFRTNDATRQESFKQVTAPVVYSIFF
jgi:hypothetical protein